MNSKITLPRLINILSETSGRSKKSCEDFLRNFFSVISENLENGETVKIRDLGVFKITSVETRKSVNVATGEEYIIPEHKKVTFFPSKSLASAVNAPFEMFETVEVSDGVSDSDLMGDNAAVGPYLEDYDDSHTFDSSSATTIGIEEKDSEDSHVIGEKDKEDDSSEKMDFVEEDEMAFHTSSNVIKEEDKHYSYETKENLEEAIRSGSPEEEAEKREDDSDSLIDAKEDKEIQENKEIPKNEEILKTPDNTDPGESTVTGDSTEQRVLSPADSTEHKSHPSSNSRNYHHPHGDGRHRVRERIKITDEYQERKRAFSKGFLWGIVTSCLLIVIGFFVIYFFILNRVEKILTYDREPSEKVEVLVVDEESSKSTDIVNDDSKVLSEKEEDKDKKMSSSTPATEPSDLKETAKKVYDTISETRYLTTIAKEHYGNYHLWPYIYEENKNILGHPDRIRPGTKVVVPPLSKYGVNPKSQKDIDIAKAKGVEIYNRYK